MCSRGNAVARGVSCRGFHDLVLGVKVLRPIYSSKGCQWNREDGGVCRRLGDRGSQRKKCVCVCVCEEGYLKCRVSRVSLWPGSRGSRYGCGWVCRRVV